MRALLALILLSLGQGGIAARVEAQADPVAEALHSIDEEVLRAHENFLASDALEGRAAGFPGNEKAVAYLVKEAMSYQLKPAGTWTTSAAWARRWGGRRMGRRTATKSGTGRTTTAAEPPRSSRSRARLPGGRCGRGARSSSAGGTRRKRA